MAVQNQDEAFENFESSFFSFESVLSSDKTDPDKNFFNNKFSIFLSRTFRSHIRTIKQR